jgi:hypothetical protein
MNTEYRRGIRDALLRITATTVVEGESPANLIGAIAERVADLSKPTNAAASEVPAELVDRFLTWPVPAEVYPDGTPGQPGRTGTNLLSAPQAKAMLQHVLGG